MSTQAKEDHASPGGDTSGLQQFQERLEELYQQGYLYRLCFRFLRHAQNAEDAAGEVFLQAQSSLQQFRGEAAFKTWLYRVASSRCLNRLRGERSETWDDSTLHQMEDPGQAPGLRVQEKVYYRQLVAAIEDRARSGKPPWDDDDYLIFEMYFGGDKMAWPAIAQVLGRPVDTVKYHYYRHVLPTLQAVGKEFEGQ